MPDRVIGVNAFSPFIGADACATQAFTRTAATTLSQVVFPEPVASQYIRALSFAWFEDTLSVFDNTSKLTLMPRERL